MFLCRSESLFYRWHDPIQTPAHTNAYIHSSFVLKTLRREKLICQLWLWIHRKTSKSHRVAPKVSLMLKIASWRRWSFKMHEHEIKAEVSRPISCSASVWVGSMQRDTDCYEGMFHSQKRHIGACAATRKTMLHVVHSKPITSRTTCT